MRSANEKKMFDLLLDEIEDTLQDIEQRCLKIETSDQAKELQVIFRAAHNVKGAAQLYGLNEFGQFVHAFEDLLTTLQKVGKPVTAASVDMLLSVQTFLRNWVQSLREEEKSSPDTSAMKFQLKAHIEDLKSGKFGADTPAAPTAQPTEKTESPTATPSAAAKPASGGSPAAGAAPKAGGLASSLVGAVTNALQAPPPEDISGLRKVKRNSSTLRIPSQKIDEIMQLIGELSIHQGILWHNYQSGTFNILNCKNAVVLNQKNLKDLYELILTLRMQSADSLFQRIERVARDIARDQKKKVEIILLGADTPLDKTVIELITDPMVHLVRNAIDHGIEDEDTRTKLGKPVPAKLTIQTQQDSGHVVISISDDGRGLDPQLIFEKAVKKGLVATGTKMKDDDIQQLIFLPGFSTRDQVSEISGRGVGMDIVQKAIQALGGRIEIISKKGSGTTFQITLPASLEIIEGLLIRCDNHMYIAPRQDVVEIIDLDAYTIESIGKRDRAIRMRDAVVPVEDLVDYIGLDGLKSVASTNPTLTSNVLKNTGETNIALIIRLPDRSRLALRVDAVLSQQQIVVRPLSEQLAGVPGFSGVTILGNGEPTMILNAGAIGESYLKWIHRNADPSRSREPRGVA